MTSDKKRRFAKVKFDGQWAPPFLDPDLSLREACDRFAAKTAALGCTAMDLNILAEPYHAPLAHAYPDEYYVHFGGFGPSFDLFAASEYNAGIFPEFMLETNLRRLRMLSEAAAAHGLTGQFFVCEPKMQHPAIFDRHPSWRGPRVDNPACSQTPLFALDTDLPEVMDHYRQMLAKILDVCACRVEDIMIFTQDSGAGFSYAEHLYAGPNGPQYNRDVDIAQRVLNFCLGLREVGLRYSDVFDVTLCCSFSRAEVERIQRDAPAGVHFAIHSDYAWNGGLEDMWAWNQCRSRIDEVGFDAARQEREKDYRSYINLLQEGRKPRCLCLAPHHRYQTINYSPDPWEYLEIIEKLEDWGAEQLLLRGVPTHDEDVVANVNQEALARFLDDPSLSPDQAVQAVVADWIPPEARSPFLKGLRHAAGAMRFFPNYHSHFELSRPCFPGPLVPNPFLITAEERAYYWCHVYDTVEKIKGRCFWIHRLSEEDLKYILNQFEKVTFPKIDRALEAFDAARRAVDCSEARARIDCQSTAVKAFRFMRTAMWNTARMNAVWQRCQAADSFTASEIVADEIANTQNWLDLLGDNPKKVLLVSHVRGATNGVTMNILDDLRRRIEIMERRMNESPLHISEFTTVGQATVIVS